MGRRATERASDGGREIYRVAFSASIVPLGSHVCDSYTPLFFPLAPKKESAGLEIGSSLQLHRDLQELLLRLFPFFKLFRIWREADLCCKETVLPWEPLDPEALLASHGVAGLHVILASVCFFLFAHSGPIVLREGCNWRCKIGFWRDVLCDFHP